MGWEEFTAGDGRCCTRGIGPLAEHEFPHRGNCRNGCEFILASHHLLCKPDFVQLLGDLFGPGTMVVLGGQEPNHFNPRSRCLLSHLGPEFGDPFVRFVCFSAVRPKARNPTATVGPRRQYLRLSAAKASSVEPGRAK
jgi:hypothetical protein